MKNDKEELVDVNNIKPAKLYKVKLRKSPREVGEKDKGKKDSSKETLIDSKGGCQRASGE